MYWLHTIIYICTCTVHEISSIKSVLNSLTCFSTRGCIDLCLYSTNGFIVGVEVFINCLFLPLDLCHVLTQGFHSQSQFNLLVFITRYRSNPTDVPFLKLMTTKFLTRRYNKMVTLKVLHAFTFIDLFLRTSGCNGNSLLVARRHK